MPSTTCPSPAGAGTASWLLTPNVTTDGSSGLVSYRGISGLYNNNTVDGANNNQAFFSEARGRANSGAYVYSMDSIQEYQVSSSNYSASWARRPAAWSTP